MEIKNLYGSIDHSHQESIKVVEKAKTNPKLPENLTTQLDAILRSLEVSQQADNFSVRSESNKSQASHRPLKTIEKSNQLRSDSNEHSDKKRQAPMFQEAEK